jgi:hypothetical protein
MDEDSFCHSLQDPSSALIASFDMLLKRWPVVKDYWPYVLTNFFCPLLWSSQIVVTSMCCPLLWHGMFSVLLVNSRESPWFALVLSFLWYILLDANRTLISLYNVRYSSVKQLPIFILEGFLFWSFPLVILLVGNVLVSLIRD